MEWLREEVLSYLQVNRLSLIFSFQSGGQISTEARVTHVAEAGEVLSVYAVGDVPTLTLISLIERSMLDVVIGPGSLDLRFDNGERVRIDRETNESEVAFISFANGHEVVV